MTLQVVVPTAAQKADPMYQLERLESRIRSADERGLKARWESGKKLRALKEKGYDLTQEQIAARLDVSQQELSFRMRFAESEDALTNAVSNGWSWHETCKRMAELVGRTRAPRKTSKTSIVIKETKMFVRRLRTALRKVHAADLTEADLKVLDAIQEEIARIYEELDQ